MQLTTQAVGVNSFNGTQLRRTEASNTGASRSSLSIYAARDIQGRVVSIQADKTAVVQVDRYVPHRLYGKRVRKSKKFHVHDEENACGIGDTVQIVASAPVSKLKSFKLGKIVAKSDI